MSSHSHIANIAALILMYLVVIPLILIYTLKFYKNRCHLFMQHRDPIFVLCLNCFIIFGMLTDRTLKIMVELCQIEISIYITGLFSGIYTWAIVDLVCIKSYLLFFQHEYHDSIQNISWKKDIDSSWTNWYIQNKNKWGCFSYIIRWVLIPYLMTIIIESAGEQVFGWLFMFIFHIIAVIVPISLLIIFTFRLRKFHDIYGIRKEILYQIITILMCGIMYFIASYVIKSICGQDTICLDEFRGSLGTYTLLLAFSIIGISSVYYPLYLMTNKQRQNLNNSSPSNNKSVTNFLSAFKDSTMLSLFMQHLVTEFATENLLFIVETIQIKYNYQISQRNVIKISNIKQRVNGLDQTNKCKEDELYLTVDFNINPDVDDIVSVSEKKRNENGFPTDSPTMTPSVPARSSSFQIKRISSKQSKYIQTYLFDDQYIDNMTKIEIRSDLPTSNLLTKHPNSIKNQIAALYDKYFVYGSNFEINLPFFVKQNVNNLLMKSNNDKNINFIEGDWFWSMDESCFHILKLLINPFWRFKKTQIFKQYVNSKQYQTKNKDVEMIHPVSNPKIYSGSLYPRIYQKYVCD